MHNTVYIFNFTNDLDAAHTKDEQTNTSFVCAYFLLMRSGFVK
nr:MAG TPA: hypothetical protein [Caudoviricetes sp.]